ncbi:MAG: hypothetical protein P794_06340 [Epsilonproteobacteria bacterium (ex Lamellibrachia satsuma)]|nr:MAG: hypothetical protein P794_06340 [Epsilonproteobacteria bacterium (ex Lamellibrachia satsuma)]
MKNFLYLEGAYLILGAIILLITLFVTTRPFMSKGAVKKGLFWVTLVIAIMVGAHYRITVNRMEAVKTAFEQDKPIICESRMQRKVAQSVNIQKSKDWALEGDNFVSPYYSRPFFSARCIVK